MKKAIIVIICAIFIASIAIVNFFGLEIAIFEGDTYVSDIEIENLTVMNGGDPYEIEPQYSTVDANGVEEIFYIFYFVEYGEEVRESSRGARGSLFCEDNYKTDRKDNDKEDLKNVFIICAKGTPVDYSWSGGYRAYAKNQTIDSKYQGVAFQYSAVYQCATREELKSVITQYNLRLSDFNSSCWDCSGGTPIWKGMA